MYVSHLFLSFCLASEIQTLTANWSIWVKSYNSAIECPWLIYIKNPEYMYD